jgi:hypothetical protein
LNCDCSSLVSFLFPAAAAAASEDELELEAAASAVATADGFDLGAKLVSLLPLGYADPGTFPQPEMTQSIKL